MKAKAKPKPSPAPTTNGRDESGRFRRGQAPPPTKKPRLVVELAGLHTLKDDAENANQHPEDDIRDLMAKLATFPQVEPLVIQKSTRKVIGGNGRLEAMRRLGWTQCEVTYVDCDDVTATALGISLNRRRSFFDDSILVEQLRAIQSENEDLMPAVGYDQGEIDALIADLKSDIEPDITPAEDPGPQTDKGEELLAKWKVEPGQLWIIPSKAAPGGEHRLFCGDSTKPEDVDRACGGQVQMIVTSPPYFGLRDYGTGAWEGGDEGCDHLMPADGIRNKGRDRAASGGTFHDSPIVNQIQQQYRDACPRCGARRVDPQIGLEATPDEFTAAIVGVFREVKRVLRDDGTAWVNLGDSYNSSPSNQQNGAVDNPCQEWAYRSQGRRKRDVPGLKTKDLIGIPWRVAFALQADGWYLRSDIIWAKPNPMPESVTDRPTKSHEYVFLMAKAERYYFDNEAVREDAPPCPPSEFGNKVSGPRRVKELTGNMRPGVTWESEGGRNIRSVWTIPTESFPGPHFATYPRKLVEPCVKAGTSERGCCPECGAGWERVVERGEVPMTPRRANLSATQRNGLPDYEERLRPSSLGAGNGGDMPGRSIETIGWQPCCKCGHADTAPCTVLDPFMGAGTTIVAAEQAGRLAWGVEISPKYVAITLERLAGMGLEPKLSEPTAKKQGR